MSTKKISVDPAFFKFGGSKTLKRRERKKKREKKELAKRENKELKMKLIDKIKEHKKRKKEQQKKEKDTTDGFENELEESLNYLQNLSAKHKSKKQKRRERKLARKMEHNQQKQPNSIKINTSAILQTPLIQNPSIPNQPRATILSNMPQQQESPTVIINPENKPSNTIPSMNYKPDPPYGILKHGKKPLFSIYNKTLKKQSVKVPTPIQIENNVNVHTDQFFERRQKLEELKKQARPSAIINPSIMPNRSKTLKKMKQLKTTTKRFIHLGKKNGKVGVLIKNQKTRKKILKDANTLKKRPLSKIKKYLRKHNLIKIGSNAPEHIVRSIYENSFLSGDIYNKNIDTMLHNYMDN